MDRNNALRRKLASRRGTSITFALLLFLVCTVIGVIVVVAATAAAGRVSRLAVSDARFYAVQSAAQLLRQEIEAQTVTIERIMTEQYTETIVKYTDGTVQKKYDRYGTPSYSGRQLTGSDYDFLNIAACNCVFDSSSIPDVTSTLWDRSAESGGVTGLDGKNPLQTLTMKLSDEANSALDAPGVEVEVRISATGDLRVTLSCTAEETYTVTMTFTVSDGYVFTPGVLPQNDEPATAADAVANEPDVYTWDLNSYKTDVISWKFAGMTYGA